MVEKTERISMKGTVKTFSKEKGFGFIRAENGKDVFFHYSELQMEGFKTAEVGDEVEFELQESDRGPRAAKICILSRKDETTKTA